MADDKNSTEDKNGTEGKPAHSESPAPPPNSSDQQMEKAGPQPIKSATSTIPPSAKSASTKGNLDSSAAANSRPVKSDKRKSGFFRFVFLLLLIVALAGAAYWYWPQLQARIGVHSDPQIATLTEQVEALGERSKQLSAAVQSIQESLDAGSAGTRERIDKLELQLRDAQLRIDSHSKRISELGSASRIDWLLAEAEYLIRLANQRLPSERDTRNPLALLRNADEILRDLDDPELLPVRKALSDDITALRLAAQIDREGIFLELQSLEQAVSDLPIMVGVEDNSPTDEAAAPKEIDPTADWRDKLVENLAAFGSGLKSLVVINRRAELVKPLLSAREEAVVRENLRIVLEQAQWALLREEKKIYRASLKKAGEWLAEYFQLNQQADMVLARLKELRDRDIVQKLPDISKSLIAVNTLISNRHKRESAPETAQ